MLRVGLGRKCERWVPIVGCLSFDQEPEQYLVAALLRDGKAPAKAGLLLVLKRLREAFPCVKLRIRLDAGFAGEELLEYFDHEGLEYSVCLASNAVLLFCTCCEMYWWARRLRDTDSPSPNRPRLTAATEESGWVDEAPWWPGLPGF